MKRAAERGDDIYLSSSPVATGENSILKGFTSEGIEYAIITAYELRVLWDLGVKPKNLSDSHWNELLDEILEMENRNLFKVD